MNNQLDLNLRAQLTEEEFVEKAGNTCPYCHSSDLVGQISPDFDGAWMSMETSCGDCNKQWYDVYRLVGYSEIEN